MKKTIVLLTIVLAIVAAPVFAEVTASGDIDLRFAYNADNYQEDSDNDVDVKLGATLSDFTSLSFNLSAINDVEADDNAVTLDDVTLTQDITGALGVDAGVGVAMTFGISSFEPKEYQGVAGYGDFEYADESGDFMIGDVDVMNILDPGTIMTQASLSVADMVTVDVAVYEPGAEVASDFMQYGINAYGTFGMVDASANVMMYTVDATSIGLDADEAVTAIGFNAAAAPIDGLKVGAGVQSFGMDGENSGSYGLSAAYTMDALTAGVAMKSSFTSYDTDDEFADVTTLAFNVNYAVSDAATVFAGVMVPDLAGDGDLGYEVGAKYVLDGVSYIAGYTFTSDYMAYAPGFVDEDGENAGNVFVKIKASF